MNFEQQQLMKRIADQIEIDPNGYYQGHWIQTSEDSECGFRHCIAGWAWDLASWQQRHQAVGDDFRFAFVTDFRGNETRIKRAVPLDWVKAGKSLLGLDNNDVAMFSGGWEPAENLTVPEALRKFAGGAELSEVSKSYN